MNFYDKNLSVLEKENIALANRLKDVSINGAIEVISSQSGRPTVKINNRLLHSIYDPEKEAREFIKKLKFGRKDNLIIFGQLQLYRILKNIEKHHNQCRPHQGIDNKIPEGFDYPESPAHQNDVKCTEFAGGLLKHYYVEKAA